MSQYVLVPRTYILDIPASPQLMKPMGDGGSGGDNDNNNNSEDSPNTKRRLFHHHDIYCFSTSVAHVWFTTYANYTEKFIGEDLCSSLVFFAKVFAILQRDDAFMKMLCYVERYVKKMGKRKPVDIWSLLVAGAVVSLKLEATNTNNATLSRLFSVTLEEMEAIESDFLKAMNNDLKVDNADIEKVWDFCKV
eukprot:TRINITY_DN11613_c0_g1_i1.p1 TRINITY_DN11613_c0_g1~~TRINITY_DN11613_c0_g1_i1.p1  ORF type:complete len:192 (-),score=23.69 TRINITY_DN11613_c0_g1_i1:38-613(-)